MALFSYGGQQNLPLMQEVGMDFHTGQPLLEPDGSFRLVSGLEAVRVWVWRALQPDNTRYAYSAHTVSYRTQFHLLAGKSLGIIGYGAIGKRVAEIAKALGMKVLGYDPYISVDHAWQLSRSVQHAMSEEEVVEKADYITVHIPLNEKTRGKFDKAMIGRMKKGAVLVNFARGELCETDAVIEALENGQLRRYICDFPTEKLLGVKGAICLPHIGASTPESEDNCVRMVARQVNDYIKNGSIVYSGISSPAGSPFWPNRDNWACLPSNKYL